MEGYANNRGSCMLCAELSVGCIECSYSAEAKEVVCSACAEGYWLKGEMCLPCPSDCASYSNATFCALCGPGFITEKGSCIAGSPKCMYFSDMQTCTVCENGYYTLDSNCLPCPSLNCMRCTPPAQDSQSHCEVCLRGYYLDN
jgi:hypothetical protein